jgi:AcrR family transcriptional regulator
VTAATAIVKPTRRTQEERRAQTRTALLESAARELSRSGYSSLVLERVAADAGYTRGALYHLFTGKEDLALAVVEWVRDAWYAEVGSLISDVAEPVGALIALARAHAIFCRRDIARVMMTLRVEFSGRDHAVARMLREVERHILADCERLVTAGRRSGEIPPGPPVRAVARAYLGAVEGLVINLAGQAPFDAVLAERAVRGVLGLPPAPATSPSPLGVWSRSGRSTVGRWTSCVLP